MHWQFMHRFSPSFYGCNYAYIFKKKSHKSSQFSKLFNTDIMFHFITPLPNFFWSELLLTPICFFAFTCCHTPVRKGSTACQCSCYPDACSIHHYHKKRKTSICTLLHWHHHVCTVALLRTHAHTLFSVPCTLTKWCRRPGT